MEFLQRYHRDAHDDDPKDGSLFNLAIERGLEDGMKLVRSRTRGTRCVTAEQWLPPCTPADLMH